MRVVIFLLGSRGAGQGCTATAFESRSLRVLAERRGFVIRVAFGEDAQDLMVLRHKSGRRTSSLEWALGRWFGLPTC
jgi:hypothetical protein